MGADIAQTGQVVCTMFFVSGLNTLVSEMYSIWHMMCIHKIYMYSVHMALVHVYTNFNIVLNICKFRSKQQLEIGYLSCRVVHLP